MISTYKLNMLTELTIIEEVLVGHNTNILNIYKDIRWSTMQNAPVTKVTGFNKFSNKQLYPYFSINFVVDILQQFIYHNHALLPDFNSKLYSENSLLNNKKSYLNIYYEFKPNIADVLKIYIDTNIDVNTYNIVVNCLNNILNKIIPITNKYVNHLIKIDIVRDTLEIKILKELGTFRYYEALNQID